MARKNLTCWLGCNLVVILLMGGCGEVDLEDFLEDVELDLGGLITVVQDDPEFVEVPDEFYDRGETIIIDNDVDVIVDISEEIIIEDIPDITLLGLENLTGYDISLTYYADGVFQRVFIYDGETLLLEYPCLTVIELDIEEDYDPIDGFFVGEFVLDAVFEAPFDFDCGEAIIITIDEFGISSTLETLDIAGRL